MATLVAKMVFRAVDKVSGVTSRMANNLINYQKKFAHFKRAKNIVRGVGRSLSTHVTLPAALAAKSIFQTSMAFDAVRNSAQAMARISNSAMKPVENLSRKIALNSKFDPTQIMGGAKKLFQAGMKTAAVLGVLAGATNLAAAGELNMADASDISTNVLTGMGLPMRNTIEAQKSMARVSNVLAYAASNSNTDILRLGESYKFVAPLASKAGMSVEELGASFMVMAQSGISGSEAGVAMRSAIVRMVRPTKGMLKIMSSLGMSMDDYVTSSKKASAAGFMDMFKGSGLNINPLRKQVKALFADESLKKDPQKFAERMTDLISQGLGDTSVEGRLKIKEQITAYFGSLSEGVDFTKFISDLEKKGATGVGVIARLFDAKQGGRLATLIGDGKLVKALKAIRAEAKGSTDAMAKILMRGSVGDYHRMTSAYQNMLLTIGKSGVMNEAAKIMRGLGSAFSYLSKRADASYDSLNKFFGSKGVDLSKLSPDVRKELSGLLADKNLFEDSDKFAKSVSEVISKGVGDGLSQSKAKELINDYVSTLTDTSPWLKWGVMAIGALAVLGPLTWAMTNVVSAAGMMGTALTAASAAGINFGKMRWGKINKSAKNLKKANTSLFMIERALGSKKGKAIGFKNMAKWLGRLALSPYKTIAAGIRLIAVSAGSLLLISWPLLLGAAAIGLIIAKWEGVKAFFGGFFSEIKAGFSSFAKDTGLIKLAGGFKVLMEYAGKAYNWVSKLLGVTDGKDKDGLSKWASTGAWAAYILMFSFRALGKVIGFVFDLISGAGSVIATAFDGGIAAVNALLSPLQSLKSLGTWLYNKFSSPLKWFGGTSPKVPSVPSNMVKTARGSRKVIPARAKGGDTPSGEVLVGERGPEIVHFKQPGTVIPNHKIDRLAKAKAGAKAAAMAGAMALTPMAAAAGTGQAAGNKTITINAPITITIDGSGGNAQDIAQQVERALSQKLSASINAAMHDGGL